MDVVGPVPVPASHRRIGDARVTSTEAGSSRVRTDALLAGLRARGWRPRAWMVFLGRATRMSSAAVVARPHAAAEVTVLHLVFALASGRRGRGWVGASWLLAVTHLGLLEGRDSLGAANMVTLIRGNMPVLCPGRRAGAIAVATDLIDGRLARRSGRVTAFGPYADSLADAVFWTWFAGRYEPSRVVRAAAAAAWAAPAAVVALASFARGGMAEPPHPRLLRPAAAFQVLLAARALRPRRAQVRGGVRRGGGR